MGTGKSTWLAHSILRENKRSIIVLPRITELERYEELLADAGDLVSLSDNTGTLKEERFKDALRDAQVILITHALFERHLTFETFELVKDGGWSLIMDEVVAVFEPVKLVTGTELAGFISMGIMRKEQVSEKVSQLEVIRKTLPWYLGLPAGEASANQKKMIHEAMVKDVLAVIDADGTMVCPSFSLNANRLNAFADVTVLTYPFKNSDLDYWLQIKGYAVDHMKLTRFASNNALEDFRVAAHDGRYSGKDFKDLIELVGEDQTRSKDVYGCKSNHFSCTEYQRLQSPTLKTHDKIQSIKKVMRNEFRNSRQRSRFVEPVDFMFTCPAELEAIWQDSRNGLPGSFIGERTWVPFNERATNDYADRHNLAYLYNVFPFMEVEKIVEAFGLRYDRDRYALYVLIQWVWRSAIRKGERIRLYLPSKRMRDILRAWLEAPME